MTSPDQVPDPELLKPCPRRVKSISTLGGGPARLCLDAFVLMAVGNPLAWSCIRWWKQELPRSGEVLGGSYLFHLAVFAPLVGSVLYQFVRDIREYCLGYRLCRDGTAVPGRVRMITELTDGTGERIGGNVSFSFTDPAGKVRGGVARVSRGQIGLFARRGPESVVSVLVDPKEPRRFVLYYATRYQVV